MVQIMHAAPTHAACKVEFQPFTVVLTADVFQNFIEQN